MPVSYSVNNSTGVTRTKDGYFIGGALLALSALFRIWSYPIVSIDYTTSLSHWMDALRGHAGLTAFTHVFSDYPPMYLYLLKILSYLPGYDLYWIKSLSCLFDVFLAFIVVLILRHIGDDWISPSRLFLCVRDSPRRPDHHD